MVFRIQDIFAMHLVIHNHFICIATRFHKQKRLRQASTLWCFGTCFVQFCVRLEHPRVCVWESTFAKTTAAMQLAGKYNHAMCIVPRSQQACTPATP